MIFHLVTGPCEFLVMYDHFFSSYDYRKVTGPCEFLVMYDYFVVNCVILVVTGPCEFLVVYKKKIKQFGKQPNCFIF